MGLAPHCSATTDPEVEPVIQACIGIQNTFISELRNLGANTGGGQTTYNIAYVSKLGPDYGGLAITIQSISRASYVTFLAFNNFGLNLTHLPHLVQALPKLKQLGFYECIKYGSSMGVDVPDDPKARQLPMSLAHATPSLEKFWCNKCNLSGTLPASYGSWKNMRKLELDDNMLTGPMSQVNCF